MTDTLEIGKRRAEELGLKRQFHDKQYAIGTGHHDPSYWYRADDIHRLLGEGVERNVECTISKDKLVPIKINDSVDQYRANYKTLCVGIRPIKEESREEKMEKLLREVVNWGHGSYSWLDFIKKAEEVLGEK